MSTCHRLTSFGVHCSNAAAAVSAAKADFTSTNRCKFISTTWNILDRDSHGT
ncbi:hypothetical protein BDR06DRAFT_956939 [Suillus hirtellus]|nr:hypothetical protein BDR06DRAFT_956939 [Suillus hirtellus]